MPDSNFTLSLWDFSLAVYPIEGVAEACLWLQNERGADVNMVLFCIWFGITRGTLNDTLLNNALTVSRDWRTHVVQPLRDTRNWMKASESGFEAPAEASAQQLRERIKACELEAEKIQQEGLERLVHNMPPVTLDESTADRACHANLQRYLDSSGISVDQESNTHLKLILKCARSASSCGAQEF